MRIMMRFSTDRIRLKHVTSLDLTDAKQMALFG
jgi:hypothetical protein